MPSGYASAVSASRYTTVCTMALAVTGASPAATGPRTGRSAGRLRARLRRRRAASWDPRLSEPLDEAHEAPRRSEEGDGQSHVAEINHRALPFALASGACLR